MRSLCLASWNIKAQPLQVPPDIPDCQGIGVDHYNQETLVPDVIPLEMGGCTSGDDNLLIKLPQGPQLTLDILQYPQNNPQPGDVIKTVIGPGAGIIFGTSDQCVKLGEDKIIYGFQQGGVLNALNCVNDATTLCLNNGTFQVTAEFTDFSTVLTVKDPTNQGTAYIAARNDDTDQILGYASQDGEAWGLGFTVDDASGATDGATRFAGGLQDTTYYALYSGLGGGEYYIELLDTKTGVDKVVDKDIRGVFKESCCRSIPGNEHDIFCAWYNFSDNTVRGLTAPIPLNNPNDVDVVNLGPGPGGQFFDPNFFNPACGVDQNGNGVVTWQGQENLIVYRSSINGFCRTNNTPPWSDVDPGVPFGILSIVPITDTNAIPNTILTNDAFPISPWTVTGSGSLELFQFVVFPRSTNIPTLSKWGLIAMAAILGIVGFIVYRRRKLTA